MSDELKTVLFIVEGPSDRSALEKIFKSIYKRNKEVAFSFTNGDISSEPDVTRKNVEDRIYATVQSFAKDKKLNKSDIVQVVQIFDTDGVYIPDDAIINGPTYHFEYSTTNISCSYPQRAIERNHLKKDILDYLLTLHDIKGISYEMYFMSCNLDHALYNEINLDKELKQDYADKFYERFLGHEYMFIEFLNTDAANGVPNSPTGSWQYIKEGLHSLERHTNLHVFFSQHPRPDGLL